MSRTEDQHYCLEKVREHDRARFLCTLFAPEAQRRRLLTGLALLAELRMAVRQAGEPMLGHIRLQWWQEALESVFTEHPQEQPVMRALHRLHAEQPLSRPDLLAVVEAHRDWLDAADTASEATALSVSGMPLLLSLLGATEAEREALLPLGAAWGKWEVNGHAGQRLSPVSLDKASRKKLRSLRLWETALQHRMRQKEAASDLPFQPVLALKLWLRSFCS